MASASASTRPCSTNSTAARSAKRCTVRAAGRPGLCGLHCLQPFCPTGYQWSSLSLKVGGQNAAVRRVSQARRHDGGGHVMTLTLRPTGLAAPVDGDHKDFIVMSGEFVLGRIYEVRRAPGAALVLGHQRRPRRADRHAQGWPRSEPRRGKGAVCRQLAEVAGMGRIEGSRVDASSIPAGSKSTNNRRKALS